MTAYTLFLDTAFNTLMLALSKDEEMVFTYKGDPESYRKHSAILIPKIQEAFAQHNIQPSDLSAIAVNTGPGSFTGIRTGITTAKTLGQFLELDLYGYNTFQLLASAWLQDNKESRVPLAIYLDALQGKAYHAVIKLDEFGIVYDTESCLVRLNDDTHQVPETPTIASESLGALLSGNTPVAVESLDLFTPPLMQALLKRYSPDTFQTTWQRLLPLYLQEPNITMRKKQPGTLK